jgi:hypothetical protein
MFFLDRLHELRVYSNAPIKAVGEEGNTRKSNIIFFSGGSSDELSQMVGSGLLQPSYFRSVYVPRATNTIQQNKRVVIDQQNYYDKIMSEQPSIIYGRRAIDGYNGDNLIYDLSVEMNINEQEYTYRGRKRVSTYIDFLIGKIEEAKSYNHRAIFVPVPSDINAKNYFDLNKVDSPFGYIYCAIRRRILTKEQMERLKDAVFVFYTVAGGNMFVKFHMNDDLASRNVGKLLSSLSTLIKVANRVEQPKAEEPEKNDKAVVQSKVNGLTKRIARGLAIDTSTRMSPSMAKVADKLEDDIEKEIGTQNLKDKSEDEILDILSNSKSVKQDVKELAELKKTGGDDKAQEARLRKLREKQATLSLDGVSIQEILDDFGSHSVDFKPIGNTSVLSEEPKKTNLKDFDESYFEKQMKKDLISVISAFNGDSDVKLYVRDVKSEDTSTDLSRKMTYTINFQDDRNNRHTVKFDYPIIKDGRFMNINGGKKLILKQIMLLPIVKTKPDVVEITTNYNKFHIERFGSKLSQKIEKLKKFFNAGVDDFKGDKKFDVRLGNALAVNSGKLSTLEYSEISSFLLSLEDRTRKLVFNMDDLDKDINGGLSSIRKFSNISYDKDKFIPIGYFTAPGNPSLIVVNAEGKEVYATSSKGSDRIASSISDLIIDMISDGLGEEAVDKLNRLSNAKTLTYNRVRINNKRVPLAVLLGYEMGLENMMKRYGIQYEFTEKATRLRLSDNKERIRFQDGYLVYDNTKNRNTLLLSGLAVMPTEEFDFAEFNDKEPYLSAFSELYGSRNVGKGFHNTMSLMVDPITLDVLKELNLPETIEDIILYANTLLEDTTYSRLNDMSSYRIRGAEQVNAILYKILADSFKTYKDTMKAGTPIKMSIPQDLLIKQLLESPTVDEYSVLNPSLEIEKVGAATYKGPQGRNLDSSYTTEIRAYDETMVGILAMSTPDSDKVGVVRQLTYDPAIKNTRGFLDTNRNSKNQSTNVYGPAELLSSFTVRQADPPRKLRFIPVMVYLNSLNSEEVLLGKF